MYKDLSGTRFGRLSVERVVGKDKHRNILWRCKCDCGNTTVVTSNSLLQGKTTSCGCLHKEILLSCSTKHGQSHSKLYKVWASIKQRCCNPKNKRYKDYGGRGIYLCEEWVEYENFKKWAIENGYSNGLDIDRIDNNSGYSPENCRFVTRKINCRNKRDNVFIEANGKRMTISEWAEFLGIDPRIISNRLKLGWDEYSAIYAPIGTKIYGLSERELSLLKEGWGKNEVSR